MPFEAGARTAWCEPSAEMPKELDAYLETYNTRQPHPAATGWRAGRPTEVFKAGCHRLPYLYIRRQLSTSLAMASY